MSEATVPRYVDFLRDNARWLSAGTFLAFLSSFGQTFFISVFAGEIQSTFSLSHGQWGAIYSAGTTASALVMIYAGVLSDRFRVRTLGAMCTLGLAAACLLMASVPSAALLIVAIFALRFTGQGMLSHLASVAMARWFIALRGRALAIATLGFALGEATLPILFVALLTLYDWRLLWVLAAGLALLAVLPMMRLLRTERTPQSLANDNRATGLHDQHWTRGDVLRHWVFWIMLPALLGPSAFNTAFFFQQVHLAEVKGWAHLELVALFPVYTVAAMAGMFTTGWAIDRFTAMRLMMFMLLPYSIAFLALFAATGPASAILGMALLGIAAGAGHTIFGAFWAELYGTRHLGAIKSLASAIMVFGSAIGPGVSGWLIDAGTHFEAQMLWIALYFAGAACLTWIGLARLRATAPGPA